MAITLAAVTGAIAAYFAGVTAVANIATVWQEYRRSHPKGSAPAPRGNGYVAQHYGRNIKSAQPERKENEFSMDFTDLLPEISHGPKPGNRARLKRRLSNFNSLIRSGSLSNSGRKPPPQLFGELNLTSNVQRAPDTFSDHFIGLNTGRKPRYDDSQAADHWETIKKGTACENTAAPSIAVVNWTTQVITMFIKSTEWGRGMYFRNYQVQDCNLAHFAEEFRNLVAFTGVLREGRLVGTTSNIFLAEDDPKHNLKSANTWKLLGLRGDTGGECLFLEMERAALFGLIECLYVDPTLLNVDMRDGGDGVKEFVHVDTPDEVKLNYNADCVFSVFGFNALQYSKEPVLVG
ncbi:hypothetical protein KC19_4G229900 [Ceratodon purpureus]|uniref:Uncharacterized protein n=1 Tax=Ceratodon purpureus TaxID=3225 RepID=A0A8T0IDV1_CERPU|nr:hypothetical protein KC19_4G229900 [Ceratodon purpureus]